MTTRRTSTRLEIGGGPHPLPGFEQVRCAWGAAPLPCASGSAGLIYASHVLEHVRWHDVPYALAEAHRVLVRGGALEVWVPDLAYLMAYYAAVYVKPQKRGAVDLYGELLPRPRIFDCAARWSQAAPPLRTHSGLMARAGRGPPVTLPAH